MAQKELKTSIEVTASPEIVWEVLTNFSAYDSWNPFIKSIKGEVAVGKKVNVTAGGMKFKPTILCFEEKKEFRWVGKLFFKGLFDGEHSFQIIDNKDGTSTFKHGEQFSGILVRLFSKKLDTETRSGFIEMNKKLKMLAEERSSLIKKTI